MTLTNMVNNSDIATALWDECVHEDSRGKEGEARLMTGDVLAGTAVVLAIEGLTERIGQLVEVAEELKKTVDWLGSKV